MAPFHTVGPTPANKKRVDQACGGRIDTLATLFKTVLAGWQPLTELALEEHEPIHINQATMMAKARRIRTILVRLRWLDGPWP